MLVHLVVASVCGALGKAENAHLSLKQDMYTSLSKKLQKRNALVFSCYRSKAAQTSEQSGTNGTIQAGGGQRYRGSQRSTSITFPSFFSAQSHHLDR